MISQDVRINIKTFFARMIAHFQLNCVPGDNVMDSAELINSELKCLNRWLKSNKISISADKTKYMMFSYNRNVNLPIIKIGNNKINEISATQLLCIYLDKKLNFVNHITEMSMKVAKSIGLLYKLNRSLLETIHKTYIHFTYSSILIIWYRSMAWNISK